MVHATSLICNITFVILFMLVTATDRHSVQVCWDKRQTASRALMCRPMVTACLLDIFLQTPGQGQVDHATHPRRIKAHPKSHSRGDNSDLALAEACLYGFPLLSSTLRFSKATATCMILADGFRCQWSD